MANGILGQAAPLANTDTPLYTATGITSACVKVIACNRGGSDTTFRVWVGVDGEATANKQYLLYDKALPANDALVSSSFFIGGDDVVRVRAASADTSFSLTLAEG